MVMRAAPPLVSVIIPTAGTSGEVWGEPRRYVTEAVRSLLARSTHRELEIVVVLDVDAPASTAAELRRAIAECGDLDADRLVVVDFAGDFNFSAKVNRGVAASAGDYVLLLNDDTELVAADSIAAMVSVFDELPDVGMVGAKLLYADGTVQHAGHVYHGGDMLHAYLGWPATSSGPAPQRPLATLRECSGVTAAAAMVRRELFDALGGFDPALPGNFNDVDFSLRVRADHRVMWTPDAEWYHFESRSRIPTVTVAEHELVEQRWGESLRDDEFAEPWPEPPVPTEPDLDPIRLDARVAMVVVTHIGRSGMLRACLTALRRAEHVGSIVVVDNGGRAAPDAPDSYGPGVDVVLGVPNDGYGAACNAGIAWLRRHRPHDLIGVLNDDVIVEPDWLVAVLAEFDEPGDGGHVGAVQPQLLTTPATVPTVSSRGVRLDEAGAGSDVDLGVPVDLDDSTTQPGFFIEIFTGGAVVFRDRYIDATGGFDEHFFMYYEDVDLALRGARLGWRSRCAPASTVWHVGGASAPALGGARRRYQERNRLWIAWRHGSPATIGRALWLSVRRLRHRPRRVHVQALLEGLAGAPRSLAARMRRAGR